MAQTRLELAYTLITFPAPEAGRQPITGYTPILFQRTLFSFALAGNFEIPTDGLTVHCSASELRKPLNSESPDVFLCY